MTRRRVTLRPVGGFFDKLVRAWFEPFHPLEAEDCSFAFKGTAVKQEIKTDFAAFTYGEVPGFKFAIATGYAVGRLFPTAY
jgi:hypothetical protein